MVIRQVAKRIADFRSDTVTRPTNEMFQAMLRASLDDDVLQVDRSTRDLEEKICDLTGMEDALFCCSGTMSNQLGLRVWLRGALESVLLDSRSHIYKYENAGISYHAQAGMKPLAPLPGNFHLTHDQIKTRIIRPDVHCAATRVICLENTLNGSIFPIEEMRKISQWAKSQGLIMHLDGARLWNASAETGIAMKEYCSLFDSVSLCLSKGIGAPIGSVISGPSKFINEARHFRKLFGGGWRQSGILAAAAKHGIDENFPILTQTHKDAKYLVDRVCKEFPNVYAVNKVETNMIFLNVKDIVPGKSTKVQDLVKQVHQYNQDELDEGVTETKLILPVWGYSYDNGDGDFSDDDFVMRVVTHFQINKEDIDLFVKYLKKAFK